MSDIANHLITGDFRESDGVFWGVSKIFCLTLFIATNQCVTIGFDLARARASCLCFQEGAVLMSNDHKQSHNPAAGTDAGHSETSAISATQRPDPQQDTKRDFASVWIQRAMAVSRQMDRDEDFRRKVAKRLF
jgi:hypothetical protein